MTVAARPVADFPVREPLVVGSLRSGRDDAQDLQLKLQSVVGRGRGQTDARHLFRRLDGQDVLALEL